MAEKTDKKTLASSHRKLQSDRKKERRVGFTYPTNWQMTVGAKNGTKSVKNISQSNAQNVKEKGKKVLGINYNLPPISNIQQMFDDMTRDAVQLGFLDVVRKLHGHEINVATMCSGTESPLVALEAISDALGRQHGLKLNIKHRFSAEIVPWKAAFIERNFHPPLIFRDLREMGKKERKARTAYGALEPIPRNIDILVAGFPCVDFSGVNPKKKGLRDLGESGDVLLSIIRYAKRDAPAVVILENVATADWEMIHAIWEDDKAFVLQMMTEQERLRWCPWDDSHPGYICEWDELDTKHFYIPHTRQRGYMLLVRKNLLKPMIAVEKLPGDEKHAKDQKLSKKQKYEKDLKSKYEEELEPIADPVRTTWLKIVHMLKRPTSVSVEEFLLDDENPYLRMAKAQLSKAKVSLREPDWSQCHERYDYYRIDFKLGNKRPLTKWVEGGSATTPDFWWSEWVRNQVERLWETKDFNYLRQALFHQNDALYKTRIWELSQNVYRDKDTAPSGVTGCLTPTGMPFVSTRGRLITGLEALGLTGLDHSKLILTKETQRGLQDLVGNAMTSTVVGAVIISALIAGKSGILANIERRGSVPSMEAPRSEKFNYPTMDPHQLRKSKQLEYGADNDFPLELLFDQAARSARQCRCEGPEQISSARVSMCNKCGHTGCSNCNGIPAHNYQRPPVGPARIAPRSFRTILQDVLPMKLTVQGMSEQNLGTLIDTMQGSVDNEIWEILQIWILDVVETEFYFRNSKRSECWTVIYQSPPARLELTISLDRAYWCLYGIANPNQAVNSKIRAFFKHPVARMTISGNNLLHGAWDFCLPMSDQFQLAVNGEGNQVPSWKSRLGLVEYQKEKVWSSVDVSYKTSPKASLARTICGRYELLPDCGTARGSLLKWAPRDELLKWAPAENTKDDPIPRLDNGPLFLFFDPHLSGPTSEDRYVFADSCRRLEFGEARSVICRFGEEWMPAKNQKVIVKCVVDAERATRPLQLKATAGARPATFALARKDLKVDAAYSCQESATVVVSMALPTKAPVRTIPVSESRHDWTYLSQHSIDEFLSTMAWAFKRIQWSNEDQGSWSVLPSPIHFGDCLRCAPKVPDIKWRAETIQTAKLTKTKISPYEDEVQAGGYERALKNRPQLVHLRQRIDHNDCHHVQMALNIASLVHRAVAKLGCSLNDSTLALTLRLEANYRPPPVFRFGSLSIMPTERQSKVLEYQFPVRGKRLRPEQQRSVVWMAGRESKSAAPWMEEENEEVMLHSINWRAVVKATKKAKVSGGILADVPGYGKTVNMLALIDYSKATTDLEKDTLEDGFISLKATLIVVPPHLVEQWNSEITRFLGSNYTVLVIQSQTSLNTFTISKFLQVDIIIASIDLFTSLPYWEKAAYFAAMPEGPGTGGRSFEYWYARLQERTKLNVQRLQQTKNMRNFDAELVKERKEANEDQTLNREVPTKRTRGSKFVATNKLDQATDDEPSDDEPLDDEPLDDDAQHDRRKPEKEPEMQPVDPKPKLHISNAKQWKDMKSPCLHMFRYARTVFDEFSYIEDNSLPALSSLNAPRRWILSATPSLGSFSDIRKMALLIGANLGIRDDTAGFTNSDEISDIQNNRSDSENFRAHTDIYTPAWHESRHQHAQVFLSVFARQNSMEGFTLPSKCVFQPSIMSSVERIVYEELQHRLEMKNFKMNRVVAKKAKSDQANRANDVLIGSKTAAEALLKRTSYFKKNIRETQSEGSQDENSVKNIRETQSEGSQDKDSTKGIRKTQSAGSQDKDSLVEVLEQRRTDKANCLTTLKDNLRRAVWMDRQRQIFGFVDLRLEKDDRDEKDQSGDEDVEQSKVEGAVQHGDPAKNAYGEKTVAGRDIAKGGESEVDDEDVNDPELTAKINEYEAGYAANYLSFRQYKLSLELNIYGVAKGSEELLDLVETAEKEYDPDHENLYYQSEEELEKAQKAKAQQASKLEKGKQGKKKQEAEATEDDNVKMSNLPVKITQEEKPRFENDFRETILRLRANTKFYFEIVGALRYVENAHKLSTWKKQTNRQAQRCGMCKQSKHLSDIFINIKCGHVLCRACLKGPRRYRDRCPYPTCQAQMLRQHMKPARRFTEVSHDDCRFGGKLDAIIELINSIPQSDQVLVFVQWESLLLQVSNAFSASGIEHEALGENDRLTSMNKLQKFIGDYQPHEEEQNGDEVGGGGGKKKKEKTEKTEKKQKVKALILNSSSDLSAGTNLTNASHVIFVAPHETMTNYGYNSVRTQCIGRSLRYGQFKQVHIYDFLALRTMDVDVYEYRMHMKLTKEQNEYSSAWKMISTEGGSGVPDVPSYGSGHQYHSADGRVNEAEAEKRARDLDLLHEKEVYKMRKQAMKGK
ncbi:hypothetical protein ACLMJK_008202 [Lecanora helva]